MLWELLMYQYLQQLHMDLIKKDTERNVLIFDNGGVAAVTVVEVEVIILEELMNLLLYRSIHQRMHLRNIARVLLPILAIIIAAVVTIAVVAVILEALMILLIH